MEPHQPRDLLPRLNRRTPSTGSTRASGAGDRARKSGTVHLLGAISKTRATPSSPTATTSNASRALEEPAHGPGRTARTLRQPRLRAHQPRHLLTLPTVAEDMARNLLPFVNAYRQFWQYWGAAFLKHPISISVAKENYDMAFHA